jgi:hypothetical protein
MKRQMNVESRLLDSIALGILVFFGLASCDRATAQSANAKGKISKNFYRIPYANGGSLKMNRDYVDHGNTPAGNIGPMDIGGVGPLPIIVAAADGQIIAVRDTNSECGCDPAYGNCANSIRIRHANGEISNYVHIQQGSAALFGITPAVLPLQVSQGDPIAIEGDVGFTCGDDRDATAGGCVKDVPPNASKCGRHLHFEVRRESTNEFMNPLICGIPGNIFKDNESYTAAACNSAGCPADLTIPPFPFIGFGIFGVFQADNSITAIGILVQNFASVVLRAGEKITLQPGFHAKANSYFRAEIGFCDQTANAATTVQEITELNE